jgi:hypothetical protein
MVSKKDNTNTTMALTPHAREKYPEHFTYHYPSTQHHPWELVSCKKSQLLLSTSNQNPHKPHLNRIYPTQIF